MQNYTKTYYHYFNLSPYDFTPCERCGAAATSIHHIHGRGKGKDVIINLQALCLECHAAAHTNISKDEMQSIHDKFMNKC